MKKLKTDKNDGGSSLRSVCKMLTYVIEELETEGYHEEAAMVSETLDHIQFSLDVSEASDMDNATIH